MLWHNEELNKLAMRYVRENKAVKEKPNMRLQSFTNWVNQAFCCLFLKDLISFANKKYIKFSNIYILCKPTL